MAWPQGEIEKTYYTEEEYFEFERDSFGRWEYVNGKIRPMNPATKPFDTVGGTDDHNTMTGNVGAALHRELVPRGCRVYGSDMKVHTCDDADTYPDVSVVCGSRSYYQSRNDVITNPV